MRSPHRSSDARVREKKRQILHAASQVFQRRGLFDTGMRDIAAEAGMRAGNLYYYFENKQALLAFCQEDALAGLTELAAWVLAQDLEPHHRLYLLVQGHVVRLNEGTPGSLAHLEVEALEPRWRDAIQAQRDAYEALFRRVISRGVDAGVFRHTDVKTVTRAILGAANWTVKWYRPQGRLSAAAIGGTFAELMVRGLLAPGASFTRPPVELPVLRRAPAVAEAAAAALTGGSDER